MSNLVVYNASVGWYGYSYGSDVESWHSGQANSAGGVSFQCSFKNTSTKTMKYINLDLHPINRVGDTVSCTISRRSTKGIQFTGPLEPGNTARSIQWENLWYNSTISDFVLECAEIEYMDGTRETIQANEIDRTKPQGGGCYVATAVYGSYDCPQVWTLRRYRDNTLSKTWYGRTFIHIYYAISPTLVKWFGETEWFKNMWKPKLDRMVERLNQEGVEDTPYHDRTW